MPHGYTNHTTGDGLTVTKSYRGPEAASRCAREAAVLGGLAGLLPVPPVISHAGTSLRLGMLPGTHGQDLIATGLAPQVLRACGRMLRRIHATEPQAAGLRRPERGPAVLVHGDYGPNNVLLSPDAAEVTAVVDWEWAHAGDPVADLAWCEWIVRMHHPADTAALGLFFSEYGGRPGWEKRKRAMTDRCRDLLAMTERWEPGGEGVRTWERRLTVTESWQE